MLFEAERVWLDVRCPVLKERLEEIGWRPDAADAYCRRCGQSVRPNEAEGDGCSQCAGARPAWSRIVRLGAYRPPLTRLVHEVKFTKWRRLGSDLGAMLGEALCTVIEEERRRRPDLPRDVVVMPVPTTFRRRTARGIDHSRVLAAAVAKKVKGRLLVGVVRREHRASQLQVQPSDRAANVAGAFHARGKRGMDLSGKVVVVVDDVTTTRATLRGACRAVARAHRLSGGKGRMEVWGAVVAVTELERGRGGRG
jgi:predicted amidophosphoribosyltransferase